MSNAQYPTDPYSFTILVVVTVPPWFTLTKYVPLGTEVMSISFPSTLVIIFPEIPSRTIMASTGSLLSTEILPEVGFGLTATLANGRSTEPSQLVLKRAAAGFTKCACA